MHEMKLKTRLYIRQAIIAGIAAALAHVSAFSEGYTHVPGASADQKTLEAQAQVEQLYEAGEYKRALIIYERELAPIGDKYAQYMVGFMHHWGQSIDKDLPTALAWYRLAAERNTPLIVEERDRLFASMSDPDIDASNEIFVKLWRRLGDNRLILDLIREDMEILKEKTGSRIPGAGSGPITIVYARDGEMGTVAFYERVRNRMALRMEYLNTNVEIVDIPLDGDRAVKEPLEQEVREEMAALNMRQ